jgi:hypothetical protein
VPHRSAVSGRGEGSVRRGRQGLACHASFDINMMSNLRPQSPQPAAAPGGGVQGGAQQLSHAPDGAAALPLVLLGPPDADAPVTHPVAGCA